MDIEEYYQLKNEYETAYREKMKKVRKTKKPFKMECLLCNKEGFMSFSRKNHILTASCDKSDCPKVEISLPITHTFEEYLDKVNKKIDTHMISLTRDKLNTYYNLSTTSNIATIMERLQTEQAWKATLEKSFDETSGRYKVHQEEKENQIKIQRHIRELQDFIKEGNIKEATQVYLNEIIPLRKEHLDMYNKEVTWEENEPIAIYTKVRKDRFISRGEFIE